MSERDIFLTAREYVDPTARAAFLNNACAHDPALRQRVERLLRADEGADSLLDEPIVARPTQQPTESFEGTPNPEADMTAAKELDEALYFLAPACRPDSLGRIGHYEVLSVLGRGGFGIVLRAFDEVLQRVVAVKMLAPQLAVTSPPRQRFIREARSAAKVRHGNVVQVLTVEESPLPYLVMEFIPGETLQQRIDRIGPLQISEVLHIGQQIAQGLAAAHVTGLIHRDVKPANVLIEQGPQVQVKLTDFGLARTADDASITQSGLVAGTPMYMSAEQARGERLDHRSDLFSLGSVLYVMITGRPPFRAANTLAVLKRVAEDTPRPIPDVIPEAPPWLCAIIAKLHAKEPAARYDSAQEVAELLGRGLANEQQAKNSPLEPGSAGELPTINQTEPDKAEIPASVTPISRQSRWLTAAAVFLLLCTGLGMTETTGVTQLHGTVIYLFTSEGTLVVESDDPKVSISIDGETLIISGAGVKELRVKPGQYTVQARRDGKLVRQELVTVTKNGKQVVRVSRESPPPVAKGNYALEFDGLTSYVDIPSLSRDDEGPVTIDAYVTVAGPRAVMLVRMEGQFPCQMYGWHGKQAASEWIPNGMDHRGVKMIAANTPSLTLGRRTHLAFQLDETSLMLFIDGKKVNSAARTSAPARGQERGTLLGAQMTGRGINHFFSGKLEEVRISNQLRYQSDFTPQKRFTPDKHTLALYHCDEGQADKLNDSSGNGHHGTLVAVKWVKAD